MGVPSTDSTHIYRGLSRCSYSAWCRSVPPLHGVTFPDSAYQLGSCSPTSRLLRYSSSMSSQ